ncbi:unnamed protein product [Linum tenue]|uniref:TIR domain-containing protein n=1 Tax=Linum tenue TaxID=586396 RepID=A0AAV0ID94_9ROSI|nr:unnamed protein product [Linum tenue]
MEGKYLEAQAHSTVDSIELPFGPKICPERDPTPVRNKIEPTEIRVAGGRVRYKLRPSALLIMEQIGSNSNHIAAPLPDAEYEVFLSFRGPDVRTTFADFLYRLLDRPKIRTFLDDEELRKGEKIAPSLVKAIRESKIYIPILSPGYASSKWCLQELALMVERYKEDEGRHVILPVFYLMNPKDVRHCKGPYEGALEQLRLKYGDESIRAWKDALEEGLVAESVFSEVWSHVKGNYMLVTNELIGIDSHVNQVTELLKSDFEGGASVVGIHGMGGIGKTTIAKAVYNKVFTQFERHCFLEDVRETLSLKNDGVTTLQSKIISSILWDDHKVRNASEGIHIIKDRGTDMLEVLRVDISCLDFELTEKEFRKLSRLRYLEVYSGRLTGDFKNILPNLRWLHLHYCDSIPIDFNVKKLVILDLRRCPVTDAWRCWGRIKILDLGGLQNEVTELPTSLKRLTLSSHRVPNLLELKDLEWLRWSRALEIPGDMWKLSKLKDLTLWLVGNGNDALVLDQESVDPDDQNHHFLRRSMRTLISSSPTLPASLNTLSISGYCSEHLVRLPNLVNLSNLTYLNLSDIGAHEIAGLGELRMLKNFDLWNASNLINLDGLEHLELLAYLWVSGCRVLRKLPSLSNLTKLRTLKIYNCPLLSEIQGLGELGELSTLRINRCHQLTGVMGLDKLESLQVMEIHDCASIKKLPDVSALKHLRELKITGCSQLSEAKGIEGLESLQKFVVTDCLSIKKLPDLSALEHLRKLKITGCDLLTEVMGLHKLESLQVLSITDCASIEKLPELSALEHLQELTITGCNQLTEVTGIERLESSRCLTIDERLKTPKMSEMMFKSEHEGLEPLHRANNSRPKMWSRFRGRWGFCRKYIDTISL